MTNSITEILKVWERLPVWQVVLHLYIWWQYAQVWGNSCKHYRLTKHWVTLKVSVSKLVGALSPVNHKGLHQGWTQISLYLQVINFTSHHTTSHVFSASLYSVGTQHRNLPPAGWPILFCRPTQEPCASHIQHRKNWERFWKKCKWMDQKGRNK